MPPPDPRDREIRDLKKHLTELTAAVSDFLKAMDGAMLRSPAADRGKSVAALCNALDLSNDLARHFGLGIDLKTGKVPRKKSPARP